MKYLLIVAGILTAGFLSAFTIRLSRLSEIKRRAEPVSLVAERSPLKSVPVAPSHLLSATSSPAQRADPAFPSAPRAAPIPSVSRVPPAVIPSPSLTETVPTSVSLAASSSPAISAGAVSSPSPALPPLDEQAIFRAIVKIECPSTDGKGRYVGSGFAVSNGVIVTAAHLIQNSGSDECRVIFPHKRIPSHYLTGRIEDRAAVRKRHDKEGIDVAVITLPLLAEYPEARAIFPDAYPSVPYPACEDPDMMGDMLMHFGYPSNFLNQSYLSKTDGTAIAYADIKGIETQDQTAANQSPIFSYVTVRDTHFLHPYMISRVATFYGDSGGLAFNATKQCILGPHRGGTIGGGAGENISIFSLLAWPATKTLFP